MERTFSPDDTVVVVSGLPRSGTSMMMEMLAAGGMPLSTDGLRQKDALNPRGYFEDERVKRLDRAPDKSWIRGLGGKAVKVVSPLLHYLPDTNDYRVLFMRRPLPEVVSSQEAMLAQRGERTDSVSPETLRHLFEEHLDTVYRVLRHRSCFRSLDVHYREVLREPVEQARRIQGFLGTQLDVARMAAIVDRRLHLHRHDELPLAEDGPA
jgi:hypothetical protein